MAQIYESSINKITCNLITIGVLVGEVGFLVGKVGILVGKVGTLVRQVGSSDINMDLGTN